MKVFKKEKFKICLTSEEAEKLWRAFEYRKEQNEAYEDTKISRGVVVKFRLTITPEGIKSYISTFKTEGEVIVVQMSSNKMKAIYEEIKRQEENVNPYYENRQYIMTVKGDTHDVEIWADIEKEPVV